MAKMFRLMMPMSSTMNNDKDVGNKLRYHTMIDGDGDVGKDGNGGDFDNRLRYHTLIDDAE